MDLKTQWERMMDIDNRTAELMNIFGDDYWVATSNGGRSYCASTSRQGPWFTENDLRVWLKEQHAKGYHTEYSILQKREIPQFTQSGTDDYRVLEKVRNEWSYSDQHQFLLNVGCLALSRIDVSDGGEVRYGPGWDKLFYEIGDYARAALLAKGIVL